MFHTHWVYQQALRCKDEACVVLTLQLLTNKAIAYPTSIKFMCTSSQASVLPVIYRRSVYREANSVCELLLYFDGPIVTQIL